MPTTLSFGDIASVDPTSATSVPSSGLQLSDVASVEGEIVAPAAPTGLSMSDIASVSPDTSQLDAIRGRSVADLVADKDFSPVNLLQQTKDFASTDPELIATLSEVHFQKERAGTTAAEKAKAIVTGVPVVAKALGQGIAATESKAFTLNPLALIARAAGAASTGLPGAVKAEAKRAAGEFAEVPLSVEAATAGSSDLLRRSGRTLADIAKVEQGKKAELTPEQKRNRLFDDVAGADQAIKAGEGNGALSQAIGASADELAQAGITVNPETIQELSAITDPVNFIPIGGAIGIIGKFGGKVGTRIIGQALNPGQAAKAAELLNAARNAASGLTGGGLKLAGKGIEKTGNVVEGIVGSVAGGNLVGRAGIGHLLGLSGTQIALAVGAGKALQLTGKALTGTGKIVAGEAVAVPASLALAGRVGSEVAKGVAEGGVLAIPFELGARPEEEQAILGGAGLAGAIRGAGPVAAAAGGAAQNALAAQIFKVVDQQPSPESVTYGTDPNLDAIHQTAKAALDSRSQKLVDWSRELFRDSGVEIYTLDEQNFKREVPGANARGFKVTIGETVDTTGAAKPLVRIMLNADAESVPHEIFHALTEVDPAAAKSLVDTVEADMTPAQKTEFAQYYNSLLNEGRPESAWTRRLDPDKVAEEVAAEVFSRTYLGQDLSKVSPSATQKATLFLSRILEKVGAPLGQLGGDSGAPGVSSLGIRPTAEQAAQSQGYLTGLLGRLQEDGTLTSVSKSKILADLSPDDLTKVTTQAAAVTPAQIAPVTPPGPPPIAPRPPGVRPVPGPAEPRNIRVTREQQNDFAQRRAEDTGVDQARTAAEKESPETQARVQEISTLIEQGNPVLEIVHRGVETESGAARPAGRTERRAEQEAAYIAEGLGAAPESVRNTYQKTTVPVRWVVVAGKAQLISMSLDKVIANISRLVKDVVSAKAENLLPYTLRDGKLTPAAWSQIIDDVQSYTANQANGFRGDGQPLVRPATDIGASIPAENPAYNPVRIPEDRTNAINVLMGLATDLTAREGQSKSIPGNVKGQILSELQGRTPETPAVIRPKDLSKQTFKSGRTIKEVNPLRNELVKAGVPVRELIEVTERINARDVQSVTPRPELNFRAPVTDIIRAGFLPDPTDLVSPISRQLFGRGNESTASKTGAGSAAAVTKGFQSDIKKLAGAPPEGVTAPPETSLQGTGIESHAELFRDLLGDSNSALAREIKRSTGKAQAEFRDAADYLDNPVSHGLAKRFGEDRGFRQAVESLLAEKNLRRWETGFYKEPSIASRLVGGIKEFFNPTDAAKAFEKEINSIKTGVVPGQTFNVDGTVFDPGTRSLDVVTLASVNVPAKELSPARVQAVLAPYAELLSHPDVKPGLFRLADGENVSVDINAVVDQSHRENTAKFAADNNQESFFDLKNGETVASGGDGNTRLTDVASLSAALDSLTKGEPVDVNALAQTGTQSFLPKTQQEVLDNLTSRARMRDPRIDAALIPMEDFNRIQRERRNITTPEDTQDFTVEQLFLPASALPEGVDPIVQAAVRTPKGRIFTGSWHGEALTKLADAVGDGTLGEPISARAAAVAAEDAFGLAGFGVDGFVTKSGKFLNREEAFQHAKRIEQLRENAEGYLLNQGTLETKEFAQNRQFQPKEFTAKDLEALEKKTPKVRKTTGWILPNSEFVPLDTSFHEQYLAENAASLSKRFGTKFADKASQDERLKALNAGFVRFRYDQNGGQLVIEANAGKWASVKRAALNNVLDSIGDVDNLRISLLNEQGQVVDSRSARLFDAERPEDAVQEAFSELRPGGRREFLPKEIKPASKKSKLDLAKGWISPAGDFYPLQDFSNPLQDFPTHGDWAAAALGEGIGSDSMQHLQEKGWVRFTPIGDESAVAENLTGKPLSTSQRRALKDWAIEQPDLKSLQFDNGKDRPETLHSENDESFLPKVKPTPEQLQNQRDKEVRAFRKDIKDNFPEAIMPEYAMDENGKVRISPAGQPVWKSVPYRFEESFVAQAAAEGITDPKARQEASANALAENMARHATEALKNPEIEAGKDWYNLARTKIGKVFGDDAGFFTELLGATSAQTPVPENFKQSIDAYNLFKAGKYDALIAKYREGKARWDEGTIEDMVADTGNEKPKRNQYLAWWIDKNNLKPKRSNDKLFNANSLPVLRVLDRSWKQETLGPKTPNFADNLSGASDKATIDVWAARAVARAGNEGNPNRWRLVNFAEAGVSDKDFFFGQDVFQKAADKIGMKPHELQALLWFAEKDRWGKNGWTSKVGEEKSDFNYFLDKTSRSPTGELVIEKKAAPQLDLSLKADDLTKK